MYHARDRLKEERSRMDLDEFATTPVPADRSVIWWKIALTNVLGCRTRLSSYMLARIAFAFSLLGWFGVNINLFGAIVFVPIAAIIAVDFYLIRPTAYLGAASAHVKPVEPAALLAWGLGAAVAVAESV
jgi:purine-cytosine permease-like protein